MLELKYIAPLVLAIVAAGVAVASVVTNYWLKNSSVNVGLWKSCVKGASCTNVNKLYTTKQNKYNNSVRVMSIALVALATIGALLIGVAAHQEKLVAGALGLFIVGAAAGVVACVLYPTEFKKDGANLGYSYWLQVVATGILAAATVYLGVLSKDLLADGGQGGGGNSTTNSSAHAFSMSASDFALPRIPAHSAGVHPYARG